MTTTELAELILGWAKERNEPFMTAEVFNDIEAVESSNDASQAISILYRKGLLARRKVDGIRFSYTLPENSLEGYETIVAGIEPVVETKHVPEQVVETGEEPREKTLPSAVRETKRSDKQQTEKTEPEIGNPLEIKVGEALKLPEHFSLRLETPGGITITITAMNN